MAIYQSIHRGVGPGLLLWRCQLLQVKGVTLGAVEKQDRDTFVTTLEIETEDGERLVITLFSRSAEALAVRQD